MSKIRVLLAEDHVVVREGTRELLEREADIEVVGEAGDGEEASQQTLALHPDVVVMDIAMPKMNGIEATKEIKRVCPEVAVLILTAYDSDQYVFALLDAGASGYLLKHVPGRELIGAIRGVNAGEAVLHPAVTRKVLARLKAVRTPAQSTLTGVLTERELEVLRLAGKGMATKDIASELSLSVRTVQAHLGSIFNKMGVGSRTEAVLHGLKAGWLYLDEEGEQLTA